MKSAEEILADIFNQPEKCDWYPAVISAMHEFADNFRPAIGVPSYPEQISTYELVIEKQRKKIAELTEKLEDATSEILKVNEDNLLGDALAHHFISCVEKFQTQSPKDETVFALLNSKYSDVFNAFLPAIKEYVAKTAQAPALPEATVAKLKDLFFDRFDIATYRAGVCNVTNKHGLFDLFLPAIQEYVAGQLKESKEREYATQRGAEFLISSKDAEIKALEAKVSRLEDAVQQKESAYQYLDQVNEGFNKRLVQQLGAKQTGLRWVRIKEGDEIPADYSVLRITDDIGSRTIGWVSPDWIQHRLTLGDTFHYLDESAAVPDARQEAIDVFKWMQDNQIDLCVGGFTSHGGPYNGKRWTLETIVEEYKDWQAKKKEVQNGQ